MIVQSSLHLQGSVRTSHYVISFVYKMRYILSLLCSGTSTIYTNFHQALQIQIGYKLKISDQDKIKYLLFWKSPFLGILYLPNPNASLGVNYVQDWQRRQKLTHSHTTGNRSMRDTLTPMFLLLSTVSM